MCRLSARDHRLDTGGLENHVAKSGAAQEKTPTKKLAFTENQQACRFSKLVAEAGFEPTTFGL
jgi:hypothetical protein